MLELRKVMEEFECEEACDDFGNPYQIKENPIKKAGGWSLFNVSMSSPNQKLKTQS